MSSTDTPAPGLLQRWLLGVLASAIVVATLKVTALALGYWRVLWQTDDRWFELLALCWLSLLIQQRR